MTKSAETTAVAQQVSLAVQQLDSLSTLPEVAAGFLAQLSAESGDTSALVEIVESDPALAAKSLSLAYDKGVVFKDNKPSVSEAFALLGIEAVREAVLSVKVFQPSDAELDGDGMREFGRRQLGLHSLATACCAREIAAVVLPQGDRQLAFSAGLLHDIGKIALDEVMPKSFQRIFAQARAQNADACSIEQKYLGCDHTIIGKRLAEKWNLPREIVLAVWLHHSDMTAVADSTTETVIARIVQLADIIARQLGIGESGSFDTPDSGMEIARSLPLSAEQVDEIRGKLPDAVGQRSDLLGLETRGAAAVYSELIAQTASKLAHDNAMLRGANDKFKIASVRTNFISEFLSAVAGNAAPIEIAAKFAAGFRKHYQTGPVCLFLRDPADESFLQGVTIDDCSRETIVTLNAPQEMCGIFGRGCETFAISNAGETVGWLFDQIALDIDTSRAKVAPLGIGPKAIGAIVFEQRTPAGAADQLSLFSASTAIGANVLALALDSQRRNLLAEQFAQALGRGKQMRASLVKEQSLAGVAEMAAGAGHELNNPLAVISGRVQLLYESETDENKKQTLAKIQAQAKQVAQIVDDLMDFAMPSAPVPGKTTVQAILDAAVEGTAARHKLDEINVQFEATDALGEVYVDSGQVTRAVANILSNALESYEVGSEGGITIDTACAQAEGMAVFRVIDFGCGMDARTVSKATQPFFSAKPAGRGRGMGLAHAQRLLELNGAQMVIASRPDEGTTVTISLRRA